MAAIYREHIAICTSLRALKKKAAAGLRTTRRQLYSQVTQCAAGAQLTFTLIARGLARSCLGRVTVTTPCT
jgi:hypothetical protein